MNKSGLISLPVGYRDILGFESIQPQLVKGNEYHGCLDFRWLQSVLSHVPLEIATG
jgi:hypothetical protein